MSRKRKSYKRPPLLLPTGVQQPPLLIPTQNHPPRPPLHGPPLLLPNNQLVHHPSSIPPPSWRKGTLFTDLPLSQPGWVSYHIQQTREFAMWREILLQKRRYAQKINGDG